MIYINSKLINLNISNPFGCFWKAKKYFKLPKVNIQCGFGKGLHKYRNGGILLDIIIRDVQFKWKYNSIRHEEDPCILINLFSIFWIYITPTIYTIDEFGTESSIETYYWETLLEWIYDRRDRTLFQVIQDAGYWKYYSDIYSKWMPVSTFKSILNKEGIKLIKQTVNERRKSNNKL